MKHVVFFWASIMLLGLTSAGVNAQQFSLRRYSAVDGLPQSEVRAMVEDKNGYLWIATEGGGLARFDGHRFQVYTTLDGLLSNIVTTLFIDSKQTIWMAHPRGITRFDGQTFKRFLQPAQEVGARRIRRIYEQGDSIFFITHPGTVGMIVNDSVHAWSRPFKPNKTIFFTYIKPGRALVHYLNDSSFYYRAGNRSGIVSHKAIFGQARNIFTAGQYVVIKSDLGYHRLNMARNALEPYSIPIDRHIIYYDSASQTYWTREANKLLKEKIVGGKVISNMVYDGAEITQVLPDGEGNVWIGSMGDGLIRHYTQDFSRCGSNHLKMVMTLAADHDNAMWIGAANSGLWRMHNGKIDTYQLPNASDGVSAIKISTQGSVYIAHKTGLGVRREPSKVVEWLNRSHGLSSSYVTAIEPDTLNGMWVGTSLGGLNYFDGKAFSLVPDDAALKNKNITALKFWPRLNTLFVGTDFGLYEHTKRGQFSAIRITEFDNTSILSLATFRDSLLLVGSGGAGFAWVDPNTKKKRVYTPKDGLSSGFVFFVTADADDFIWIGTVNGISRIRLNAAGDFLQNQYFGYDNGLIGIEANQNAFYITEQAKYFGLIDGLYQFNDVKIEQYTSYPTHLTAIDLPAGFSIEANGNALPAGFFKIPTRLSLPHTANQITFHYNKVDKRNPKSVQYKYRLDGFDKEWSHPTTMTEVTYANLRPGTYSLQVLATNKDGTWEATPLNYTFIIRTPFYQTAWFAGLVFLLVVASILFGIMYRVRSRVAKVMEVERIRQQEQETLRKEIARDFHDEMGNQLTRIINYVSLLKLTANGQSENGKPNNFGELFNKVEASAKNLYTGTRDFIWAIDPLNDELSQLFIHLRDFGVKLFEEKSINFRAFNQVGESVRLPYGFSREANLVFKEAMTNAFKHSEAGNVTLTLSKQDGGFQLELMDDGIGFNPSAIHMNGLKNIQGRAERIKATLLIQGEPGQGTKVILQFISQTNIVSRIKSKTT